jgi:hypothetical protein
MFLTRMLVVATIVLALSTAFAQSDKDTGKVSIKMSPKQAYVFVDGKAIREGSHAIDLTPGDHTITVRNYGYSADSQKVQVTSGNETKLNVDLHPYGGKVSGPFADLEFKGDRQAAVLLNGDTPAYFVGRAGEFDWDWLWHRRLLVQPGSYHVTVMREGNTIWTGNVTATAGQKVIIHLNDNGREVDKNFAAGEKLGPQPRFHAGILSRTVPVAPVTAVLEASSDHVDCGAGDTLKWNSTDAVNTSITELGSVPISGDRTVNPTRTTTYQLVAQGPGGEVKRTATIDVNAQPTATIAFSQPEVRYHKIGDKVVEDDSATLKWSTSNGNKVIIQPMGAVASAGNQVIHATPANTGNGPVDQDVTYTLNVANGCGGTATRSATLHIVGSIDPAPSVTLASLFYPTAYPEMRHPRIGLVTSEEMALEKAAVTFTKNQQFDEQGKLMIVGHADARGSKKYNQALSERRAMLVKRLLMAQGISSDKLETKAEGKDDQIPEKQIVNLQAEDPQHPQKWMTKRKKDTWLAYNRRVDIVLEPKGQQSADLYPNDVPEARLVWQRPVPSLKAVESASKMPQGKELAQAQSTGN